MGSGRRYYARNLVQGGAVGNDFISTWRTTNTSTGSSSSNQIKLPLVSSGIYDFTVDWGDGNSDVITAWDQSEVTHSYGSTGDYTLTISGTCDGWSFNNTADRLKLLTISQWGDILFNTQTNVFYGCANLQITAIDNPILPVNCTNFLRGCTLLTGNSSFNNWDFSAVVNATGFFFGARDFNWDISNWDVSNVTSFNGMFQSTNLFNQDIGGWNVSSGSIFSAMFQSARDFDQDIGGWNVSNGTLFINMFLIKSPSTFSPTNLDAIYNGWTNRILSPSESISFSTAKHTAASTPARALLTRTNSTVSISNAVNNGSGLIRISTGSAHGRTTGDKIFISGVTGTTEANGGWIVTVIDASTVDLQGSIYANTYVSGGTFRIGYGWTITDGGL